MEYKSRDERLVQIGLNGGLGNREKQTPDLFFSIQELTLVMRTFLALPMAFAASMALSAFP